jgi:hypothetical protein
MKLLLLSFVLLLLCGCAVMDISVMDTAEPLQPGKVKIETYAGTGLILESTVYDNVVETGESHKAAIWPVNGFRLGMGIADKTEAGGKVWFTGFSAGAKAYLKYLLQQNNDTYYAIIPAITYVKAKDQSNNNSSNLDYEYKSVGAELPFLVTRKVSEYLSLTAAARLNYNSLEYSLYGGSSPSDKHGPYSVVHGGILGNARLKYYYLVLTPEVGVEFVPVVNGAFTVLPNYGLSVGLQF